MAQWLDPFAFGTCVADVAVGGFRFSESRYAPRLSIAKHKHQVAQLCLVLRGAYKSRGVRCEAAMMLYHPPEESHDCVVQDDGVLCLEVAIDPPMLACLADAGVPVESLGVTRQAVPHRLAWELRRELRDTDPVAGVALEELTLTILGHLARRPGIAVGKDGPAWLDRIRERIDDEFVEPWTLSDLADTAGIHPVHLSRTFRERYATTIGDYVRQRRVEEACRRLLETGDSLSAVALATGFADQAHLTRTFRKYLGEPPGRFRARYCALR